MARSIKTLPAMVKRKNFMAAYILLGPPQMPMRRYMGMSISSQKM